MGTPRMTTRRWAVAVVVIGLRMGGMVGGFRLKRKTGVCVPDHPPAGSLQEELP
jgi:hypothetical protein